MLAPSGRKRITEGGVNVSSLTRRRGAATLAALAVFVGALAVAGEGAGAGARPTGPEIDSRTGAKPTLSPRLADLQDQGATTRAQEPEQRSVARVSRRADGAVLVHVRVEDGMRATVVRDLESLRGVEVVHETTQILTAHVPVDLLDEAAAVDGVRSVFESLEPEVRCGTRVTEGDAIMDADDARSTFGVDGSGVTVGVLSDSFDQAAGTATTAAGDVATGDLPGTGSPCGSTTDVVIDSTNTSGASIDEGRAMAQIVHDLAPGADIVFGSAVNGLFDFADQVRALRGLGADVIVDDIGYFAEPFFQQGPVGDAVEEVVADGASYVSAIGNDRNTDLGTDQSSYETPAFRSTPCAGLVLPEPWLSQGSTCHDFNGGPGVDPAWTFTVPPSGNFTLDFQWNEPWLGIDNDFDLFAFDMAGNVIDASINDNFAAGIPFELLDLSDEAPGTTFQIAIVRFPETPGQPIPGASPRMRWLHLRSDFTSSEYTSPTGPDSIGGGYAYGHPVAPSAIGVGAAPYFSPTTPEPFSSRGPATYYWGPVGDMTGPAPALGTPQVVPKPDVAGIDGGANTFFGQQDLSGTWRFFGTSAAAPHVAAVLALMREANPTLSEADLRLMLEDTANPLATGDPTQWGAGLVDADAAVGAAVAARSEPAKFTPVSPARLLDTRHAIGYVGPRPGAGQTVEFQVTGEGGVPASGVNAVVLTLTGTEARKTGFVTAHPAGRALPLAASINLERAGQTISNQVIVAVPDSGRVAVYTSQGAHIVADVVGYFSETGGPATDGRFAPLTPTRLLDTRNAVGYAGPKPADQSTVTLQVGGQGGVPADAVAVIMNVTATETTNAGFVTAHPAHLPRPTAAALTTEPSGQDIGTLVTVGLSPAGQVDLFASRSTHLVGDVVGYYTAPSAPSTTEGLFVPLNPIRLLDTRFGNGYVGSKPAAGQTFTLQLAGRGPIPASGVAGTALNLTLVGTTGAGFVTFWPADVTRPQASSLNSDQSGQTRQNLVASGLSPAGAARLYTSRSAHLVGDVAGYFVGGP